MTARRKALRLARDIARWHGECLRNYRGERIEDLLNDLPHYVHIAWHTISDDVLNTVI